MEDFRKIKYMLQNSFKLFHVLTQKIAVKFERTFSAIANMESMKMKKQITLCIKQTTTICSRMPTNTLDFIFMNSSSTYKDSYHQRDLHFFSHSFLWHNLQKEFLNIHVPQNAMYHTQNHFHIFIK